MELSNEDSLRLNVLLRQSPKAIRIDESKLVVYGLTERGEASIALNPSCKREKYIWLVRELLSSHVLGSPGGYPIYIRRWTRLGQERDSESLKSLLLLGEPEAVTAVVHTPGITADIAALAWWALPTADIARQLLNSENVVEADIGKELAEYLIEFLPFEENHQAAIDSTRLALRPGLIDDGKKAELWRKAKRRQTYYIGFLHSQPDSLPIQTAPHPDWQVYDVYLSEIDDPVASLLRQTLSPAGQSFVTIAKSVFQKLPNQDAAVELLEAIGNYFQIVRPDNQQYRSMVEIEARIDILIAQEESPGWQRIATELPQAAKYLRAIFALSMLNEYTVAPIFGHSDAIGSVMRKRLEPVTIPVMKYITAISA